MLTSQSPLINGDGDQTRDYTYVEDVALANLRALERPDVTGAVNVCTGVETTVNKIVFCREVQKLGSFHDPEADGWTPRRLARISPPRMVADAERRAARRHAR